MLARDLDVVLGEAKRRFIDSQTPRNSRALAHSIPAREGGFAAESLETSRNTRNTREPSQSATGPDLINADCVCHTHGEAPHLNTYYRTGSTGITVRIQHSGGVLSSREGEYDRSSTGTTGSIEDLRRKLSDGEFEQLDPASPPGDVPRRRWAQFLVDATSFVADGFEQQARALGWSDADLYGMDDERPFARIDLLGLVWLLNGNHVVLITDEMAVIETQKGVRSTYRRMRRSTAAR